MKKHQPKRRALIVLTSHDRLGDTEKSTGFYLSEVTHVYYPLVEAGFEVDFASPNGGAAPLDEASQKPRRSRQCAASWVTRTCASKCSARRRSPRPSPSRYDVVHFAGGHGVMWDFPSNPDVQRVAAQIYEQGGIVAAVCHGPAALVNVKLASGAFLVAGKQVAAFTNSEEQAVGLAKVVPFLLQSKLEERGARVSLAANWQSQAVVSERLVTGQNPQSAHAVARGIVELARTQARARCVGSAVDRANAASEARAWCDHPHEIVAATGLARLPPCSERPLELEPEIAPLGAKRGMSGNPCWRRAPKSCNIDVSAWCDSPRATSARITRRSAPAFSPFCKS